MREAFVFGGTTEGRLLYAHALTHRIPAVFFVATDYGARCLLQEENDWRQAEIKAGKAVKDIPVIHQGRLSREEMLAFMQEKKPPLVLDATHPYAVEVTENIRTCCKQLSLPYVRVQRSNALKNEEGLHICADMDEAISFLEGTEGNIFVTTGSKALEKYTALTDYRHRVYARILPDANAVSNAASLGIEGRHLAAMQGPFSEEMNYAFLKEFSIRFLVTKMSGSVGGFPEKCLAAKRAGAVVVAIAGGEMREGISLEEAFQRLEDGR